MQGLWDDIQSLIYIVNSFKDIFFTFLESNQPDIRVSFALNLWRAQNEKYWKNNVLPSCQIVEHNFLCDWLKAKQ